MWLTLAIGRAVLCPRHAALYYRASPSASRRCASRYPPCAHLGRLSLTGLERFAELCVAPAYLDVQAPQPCADKGGRCRWGHSLSGPTWLGWDEPPNRPPDRDTRAGPRMKARLWLSAGTYCRSVRSSVSASRSTLASRRRTLTWRSSACSFSAATASTSQDASVAVTVPEQRDSADHQAQRPPAARPLSLGSGRRNPPWSWWSPPTRSHRRSR